MMRIWLADLPAAAQEEIASKRSPLGRVLIEHNVLREVELITLWKIIPGPVLRATSRRQRQGTDLRTDGADLGR